MSALGVKQNIPFALPMSLMTHSGKQTPYRRLILLHFDKRKDMSGLGGGCVRRRDFIRTIAGSAVVWPLAARASDRRCLSSVFSGASRQMWAPRLRELRRGLSEVGFTEGQNLSIEYRWAQGRNERLPSMATELVRHQVRATIAPAPPAALPLRPQPKQFQSCSKLRRILLNWVL